MIINTIPKNKLTKARVRIVRKRCMDFCRRFKIDYKFTLTLDFRTSKTHYVTEGLFGGYIDMWNEKNKEAYVNLNVFREYTDSTNLDNVIHCVLHELGHIKQIRDGKMSVVDNNTLIYKNRIYDRAPFSYDVFSRIFALDRQLAQDYHTSALPWEKDAYEWAEQFMKKPLHSYQEMT